MMRVLRFVGSVLATAALLVAAAAGSVAGAQVDGDVRLGGASDVAAETVVRIPQGGRIGPLHYIFVDNPEDQPIRVKFVVDAPAGIAVEPEWEEAEVPGGERAENAFGISVGSEVAAGDYEVVVVLVRSDIEAQPGRVTNIPAVQTTFTVEVTGEAGTLRVDSISALSGQPVAGTLSAAAALGDGDHFEVARVDGSSLEVEVAPGEYRVSFLLGDRALTTADVSVETDETTEVTLEVETVSFVLAAARPTLEGDHPVVVDLEAAVNNEAEAVTTGAELQVVVLHQGAEVETITLDQLGDLPIGLTEATATYRPSGGWKQGSYLFRFELVTSDFTLVAPEVPSLDVPPPPFFVWDLRLLLLIAAGAILALLLLDRIVRGILRGIRRRRGLKGGRHEPDTTQPVDDSEAAPSGHASLAGEPKVRWAPVTSQTLPSPAADSEESQLGRERAVDASGLRKTEESPALITPPAPSVPNGRRPSSESSLEGAARVAQSVRLAQRLSDEGALAPDWSIADAAMVYWAMTSKEVHEALTGLGMDDQEYTTAITKLLHLGLLDPSSR